MASRTVFKRKIWGAITAGDIQVLEGVIWEIITAEIQAAQMHDSNCCFRRALLYSLDGSEFASETLRNELLQRFAAQSGSGNTDAQCFIGILLCFQVFLTCLYIWLHYVTKWVLVDGPLGQ